jgi:mycothione reductase
VVSGHRHPVDYTAMPHAVFSNPQVAGVGATEQELKEKKTDYLAGRYKYADTGMGEALAEKDGFVKFLTDYDGKILGCHILGPDASTLIHEVLVAMKAGHGTIDDIVNTIHIHPALSEVIQRGAGSV